MVWKRTTDVVNSASASHDYGVSRLVDAAEHAQALATNHLDFDAFMGELEADQRNNELFERADSWIAETFYGGNMESMRSLRQKKGLSQTVLASIVGTSQPQIAKIESGRQDPQLSTILKLTEALSVDANTMCAALGGTIVKKIWSSK